jgi:NADH-quinone oxidoreductase subunit E
MSVRRLYPDQPMSPFAFNAENLSWAKKTIAKYPEGKQASAVIPLLWRAQEQNNGWVTRPILEYIADMLSMAYIRVLEVATFYTMFQLQPVGKNAHIQVCGTIACQLRGAEDLKKVCQHKIHPEPHHLNADGTLSWEEVECLGACVNAPMVQVWKETFEDLTPQSLEKLIDEWSQGAKPKTGPQIDRQFSMAEGGASSLTDPALYASRRTYARVEAPPPPPPAAPAGNAPATPAAPPAPAAAAPVAPVAAAPVAPTPVVAPPVVPATTTLPPPQKFVDIVAERVKKLKVTKKRDDDAPAPSKSSPKSSAKTSGEPEKLAKPRDGKGDDLELIWGVGPGLARTLNKMGFWHFDQIANWTAAELKWVDTNLKGFKGRASRDEWVPQAKKLAKGWRPDSDVGDNPNTKPSKKSGKK